MRVNDALTGLVLIAFAAAMLAYTATFPAMPGQNYGPALFPRVLGVGLIGCGVLLIMQGARRWRVEPLLAFGDWARSRRHVTNFVLILAALLLFILAVDEVGFVPIAFVILLVLLIRLGTRPVLSAAIALAATLVIHALFAKLLLVPLPWGWLQPIAW